MAEAEKVLERIQRAMDIRRREGTEPPTEDELCEKSSIEKCELPVPLSPEPEEVIKFRKEMLLAELELSRGEDDVVGPADQAKPIIDISCLPLSANNININLTVDIEHEQRWYFREHVVPSPATAISLAPAETLRISIRNTQRKKLDQRTVDEVEELESTESSIVDKDVLNVARTSSQTNGWSVSANGMVSLGSAGSLGVSGELSESVTNTASSAAERVSETTKKSASSLKVLQKLEIQEVNETFEESKQARTLTNPYRDRSLQLNVFNLSKRFCVEFALSRLQPTLSIEIKGLTFDRDFVLRNGSFLSNSLLDYDLQFGLSQALEAVSNLPADPDPERPERMALLALEYLFEKKKVFNFSDGNVFAGDRNDPASSFDIQLHDPPVESGLDDAVDNQAGVILTTLAYYYKIYENELKSSNDSERELALDLVLSLERTLAPQWIGVEETQKISNLLGPQDYTEVLRRLGGFLSFAGVIRRKVEPAEEERAALEAANRAEFVIERIVNHLNCHAKYYTQEYMKYWSSHTRMQILRDFVEELVNEHLALGSDGIQNLKKNLSLDSLFLNGRQIIVPITAGFDIKHSDILVESLDDSSSISLPRTLSVNELIVPTDGTYIESKAGECVLSDIEPGPIAGPIHVRTTAEEEE